MSALGPLVHWFLLTPLGSFLQTQHLFHLLPEFILLLIIGFGLFQASAKTDDERGVTWVMVFWGLLLALFVNTVDFLYTFVDPVTHSLYSTPVNIPVFYDMFRQDLLSASSRWLVLLGTLLVLLMSRQYTEQQSSSHAEFPIVLIGATFGALLMTGANDLIMMFVGLETLGISSFILAGYFRDNATSAEASLKYLLYGGISTAVLLFGFSILYGLSGGYTQFPMMLEALSQVNLAQFQPVIAIMLVMIVGGLSFKLSAAPFHMWTPDVYHGAPTPVTAYLSVVSKIAAFALVIRFVLLILQYVTPHSSSGASVLSLIFLAIAVLSMVIGNLAALRQANIKRMMAYSTIAHVGYLMVAFVVLEQSTLATVIYYLMAYLFMNLGAFAIVTLIGQEAQTESISEYSGLIQKKPFMTLALTLFMLSLAGMPITAGFFAKFFLFQSIVGASPLNMGIFIFAFANSVVSMFYYLNVMRLAVVGEPSDTVKALSRRVTLGQTLPILSSVLICLVGTLLLGFYAEPTLNIAQTSLAQLGQFDPYANVLFFAE